MLIKTDANGNEEWNKTFWGRTYDDKVSYVQQTSDGGYVLAGSVGEYSEEGHANALLIKIDPETSTPGFEIFAAMSSIVIIAIILFLKRKIE